MNVQADVGHFTFDATGWLPEGVVDATLDEIVQELGRFTVNDRRPKLVKKLQAYVEELQQWKVATEIYIDGSFVSARHEPNDIDVILYLRADFVARGDSWKPTEINLVSKRFVRKQYEIDLWPVIDDAGCEAMQRVFVGKKPPLVGTKGILRVRL